MRFIVTADWHIHPWRECSLDGGQDRLADGILAARQILEAGRKHACPVVVIGDIKHVKNTWLVTVQNAIAQLFEEFSDVQKILIHGNHDGWAHGRSGLAVLQSRHTDVIDTLYFSENLKELYPIPYAAFWPYQKDMSALPEFLNAAKKKKTRILFAHAFLQQGKLGPTEIRINTGFALEDFGLAKRQQDRVFEYAFFGDIHKPQIVGKLPCAAVYPGSPYAQNWGEVEEQRGYLLVDLDKGNSVIKRCEVKAPKFQVFDLRGRQDVNALLDKTDYLDYKGHFIRFIVDECVDERRLAEFQRLAQPRTFQVVVQRKVSVEKRSEVHAGMSREKLLSEYLKTRPPENMSVPFMLKAGMKLMEDA